MTRRQGLVLVSALLSVQLGCVPPAVHAPDSGPNPLATLSGEVRLFEREDHGGVRVRLVEPALETLTAADGRYAFVQVPAGSHHLEFSLEGFGAQVQQVQVPASGALEARPVRLVVGAQVADGGGIYPLGFAPGGSQLLFLKNFSPMLGTGDLVLWDGAETPIQSGVFIQSVSFSPNGDRVLFMTNFSYSLGAGDLQAWDPITGDTTVLGLGVSLQLAFFSPDGSRFFFMSEFSASAETGALKLWDLASDEVLTLGQQVAQYPLQLEPDGAHLLFLEHYTAASRAGDLKLWQPQAGVQAVASGVSTDGMLLGRDFSGLLYFTEVDQVSNRGHAHVFTPATGSSSDLGAGVALWVATPPSTDPMNWNQPPGHFVYMRGCAVDAAGNEHCALGSWDFVTGQGDLIATDSNLYNLSFSSDGSHVAYLSGGAGTARLGWWSFGERRGAVSGHKVAAPIFAPGGDTLAFVDALDADGRGTLMLWDLAQAEPAVVAEAAHPDLRFTPDGERLLYFTDVDSTTFAGTLHVALVASGASQRVAEQTAPVCLLSPDSSRLAFIAEWDSQRAAGQLRVWDFAAGLAADVAPQVNGAGLQFTADGQALIFLTGFDAPTCQGALAAWRFASSSLSPLHPGAVQCSSIQIGPDQRTVTYLAEVGQDWNGELWARHLDAPASVLLGRNSNGGMLFASPDGRRLVYGVEMTAATVQLGLWDLAAQQARTLGEQVGMMSLRLSQDGRRLLFLKDFEAASDTGSLVAVDLLADSTRTLGQDVAWFSVALSPDEASMGFLASYSQGQGVLHGVDLRDPKAPTPLDEGVVPPLVVTRDQIAYLRSPLVGDSGATGEALFVAPQQ